MPVKLTVKYQTPQGKWQTRTVETNTGSQIEVAEVLAEEHRCRPSEIRILTAGPEPQTKAPQTTGNPLNQGDTPVVTQNITGNEGGDEGGNDGPPTREAIHAMKKADLYDLAAQHSVSVDDDPTVAELKQRLITKLHP